MTRWNITALHMVSLVLRERGRGEGHLPVLGLRSAQCIVPIAGGFVGDGDSCELARDKYSGW